jgi:hypothetical protein
MRRLSVVLLSVSAILIASGALTLAGSSAAPRFTRLVICPQLRDLTIPCCGPPVNQASGLPAEPISCCPATATCAPAVTIGTKPNPSAATGQVVISGRLLRTASTAATVVLWQQLPDQQKFQRMLQTATDAGGNYSITLSAGHVQTNRQWYATADGIRSQTISQEVWGTVTLRETAARGRLLTFAGQVTPSSHRGERVLLERRSAHGWQIIARPRLNRASAFTIKQRLPKGASELQAILPADKDNVRSASVAASVHVR